MAVSWAQPEIHLASRVDSEQTCSTNRVFLPPLMTRWCEMTCRQVICITLSFHKILSHSSLDEYFSFCASHWVHIWLCCPNLLSPIVTPLTSRQSSSTKSLNHSSSTCIPLPVPPLFPLSAPPAVKMTPRHRLPPPPSPSVPLPSLRLTLFQSFIPSFFLAILSFSLLLLSRVHFLVSLCRFEFSFIFPPLRFISCIPFGIILIILTLPHFHNTIFSCRHASQALFLSDL